MEPAPDETPLPERIGGYRILRLLGRGGMGVVFEAEQESPRRTVALKVLHAGVLSPELRRRFELEAQVLGLLQHPCIAQIHEAGLYESAGGAQPYFAMELIRGAPLVEYARRQQLDTRALLELIARICDGIGHAHQRGVIHRDLKPANILVDEQGAPKILDFGLARATDADIQTATLHTDIGQIMGTIPYMSPEQAAGDPAALDARTDIYSLGVVAYQLLSGAMPYAAGGAQVLENLRVVREQEAAPLSSINRSLRGDVETIIGKALEKDPARRYATAEDFAADIRRHLHDEPISARPPSTFYQLSKFARRNRALVLGAAAVFVALILGLIGTARGYVRASDEAHKATAEAARARRTADFFQTILLGVDPAVAQGSDTTLFKQVLDDSAERIDVELAEVPLIEASLRDTMASAYFAISEYPAALAQAQRARSLYERASGERGEGALIARRKEGTLLGRLGRFAESERTLLETLALSLEVRGGEHIETASVRNELGVLYLSLKRAAAAAALFEQVLAVRRRELGDEHEVTLITLNCLGLTRLLQHRDEEGEALLREVLETRRRISGDSHPDTIIAIHNLAGALGNLGRLEEAEALYRRSIEDNLRILGPEHLRTLEGYSNLAIHLRNTSREAESVELILPVLEAYRTRLGPGDPRTLDAEQNLALGLRGLGRSDEAVPLLRHVYETRVELYGEEHGESLGAMASLVSVLSSAGRDAEADALREACVELHRRVLGDEHEDTLVVRHDLGVQLANRGQTERAEALLREVLSTNRRVIGPDRTEPLRTLLVLSDLLRRQQRFGEYVPMLGEFLTGWSRIFGDDETYCVQAAGELVNALGRQDELGPYEDALRALLAYHRRTLPEDAPQLVLDELWLVQALGELGRHEEALLGFEAAVERWEGAGLPLGAQAAYGAALTAAQRYDEAQDMLLMAYEDAPVGHQLRGRIVQDLAALYTAWGKTAEAEAWRTRAAQR